MIKIEIQEEKTKIEMNGNKLTLEAELAVMGRIIAKESVDLIDGLLMGILQVIPKEKLINTINNISAFNTLNDVFGLNKR